eukprot:38132-Chlamydomonas_euryale.AAC.1
MEAQTRTSWCGAAHTGSVTASVELRFDADGGDGLPLPGEPSSASVPAGPCVYVYSSYRTPTLTSPATSALIRTNPSTVLTGRLLGGTDPANYTATVGGVPASVVAVADASVSGDGSQQAVTLDLPALPAGLWPVLLQPASGMGYVRSPPALRDPPVVLNYGLQVWNACVCRGTAFVRPGRGAAVRDSAYGELSLPLPYQRWYGRGKAWPGHQSCH